MVTFLTYSIVNKSSLKPSRWNDAVLAVESQVVDQTATVIANTTSVFNTSLPSVTTPQVDNYVSFAGGFADGRGLGNQLFDLAVATYVAELTGRQVVILNFTYRLGLEQTFELNKVARLVGDLCPCYTFGEAKSLMYDRRVEKLTFNHEVVNKSIFLWGFFQSWKYTRSIDRRLRRILTFRRELQDFAGRFLAANVPPAWIKGFIRVGVHVRRGDVLAPGKVEFGYTTPNEKYFHRAVAYFMDRFERVQFIVCCQAIDWCWPRLEAIQSDYSSTSVVVTYSVAHSAGQDLALLAACDHVIMSTGTYGWWAGWLAKGFTVYYADWPRNGSKLFEMCSHQDFFPPAWIGMTDS
jgi:galactoside 2-L-fucosyltransferase 1/2